MDIKKIVTCGSVDDGKSSLIGRIIFETKNILNDQELKLQNLSTRYGTTGKKLDFALLLDGLQDEREQGITIDVAHRYINYKNQRLVFHDSPGHNQYTRNVVTAASGCEIAILLIDVKKGILEQTTRHLKILDFLKIKNIIFAINKIDLVKYNKNKFLELKNQLNKTLISSNKRNIFFIPVSALHGDNVVTKSKKMKWYSGKSILDTIVKLKEIKKNYKPYLAIRHVHRPNNKTRNYLGNLIGSFKKNQKIKIFPGSELNSIKNLYSNFKKMNQVLNTPVALDLKKQMDIVRGDIITDLSNKDILVGNIFNAEVVVTSGDKIIQGRQYLIRIHNKITKVTVTKVKSAFDFVANQSVVKNELELNDIGEIELSCNEAIPFATFDKISELGRFILVDELTFNVVCAGKINFELRRSGNIYKTEGKVSKEVRAKLKRQKPKCIWLTGLSGSGKSTLAQSLEKTLNAQSKHTYILDGDNLRLGINKNLGFNASDRTENIRRIGEISKLMVDAGLIVIVAAISPFRKDRDFARSLFEKNEFYEVFVNTPLKVCIKRDPKKLYKKAKSIKHFSTIGLTGDYEKPLKPDLVIDTSKELISSSVKKIITKIF
ncbi:adenylyl-sulfate kinase [Pelagibacteraceae bacterium]|nr:adenylyl-sulfate kinase [Pelagibacteraceae bacterium]